MLPDYRLHPTVKLELTNNPDSARRQYLLSTDGWQYYVDAAAGDIVAGRLASCAAVMFSAPAAGATLVLTSCILMGAALMGSFTLVNLERLIQAPACCMATRYGQRYLVVFGVAAIHAPGHLAAAKRFHCGIDRLNVGACLISPVSYLNVPGTWKFSASRRIAVNLGGVYFQFIAAIGLLLIARFTAPQLVMDAVYVSLYIILASLSPFLKFDGYRFYADYFDILDLRSQHLQLPGSLLRTGPARWPAPLGGRQCLPSPHRVLYRATHSTSH